MVLLFAHILACKGVFMFFSWLTANVWLVPWLMAYLEELSDVLSTFFRQTLYFCSCLLAKYIYIHTYTHPERCSS